MWDPDCWFWAWHILPYAEVLFTSALLYKQISLYYATRMSLTGTWVCVQMEGREIDAVTFSHGYVESFFLKNFSSVPWNCCSPSKMVVGTTFFLGTGFFSENHKKCLHTCYIPYSCYIFFTILFSGCRNVHVFLVFLCARSLRLRPSFLRFCRNACGPFPLVVSSWE